MSVAKCKRNVMGHYTTKPMLLSHGRLNIKVKSGRLDETLPLRGMVLCLCYLQVLSLYVCGFRRVGESGKRVTYYRCLGKVDR